MAYLAPRITALTVDLSPGQTALRLLPAGSFRARDGRPTDCPAWLPNGALTPPLVLAAGLWLGWYGLGPASTGFDPISHGETDDPHHGIG